MPKLDWIGKQYVVNHTDEVPFRLLERVPEASVGGLGQRDHPRRQPRSPESTFALLQRADQARLIDPPYNTGNENWVYNDRMNAPKIKEWLGNDWAALDPERRYFKMVTKSNMQSTLKEIEDL